MNKEVLKKMYSATNKVELSEVQIDLAVIDDIKKSVDVAGKAVNSFLNAYKVISAQKDTAISNGETYYKTANELRNTLKQFEAKAKELGIDALENKDYKTASDLLVRYDIDAVFERVDGLRKLR
jgi:hypothetical protein